MHDRLFPLSCSSLLAHIHFYSLLLVLKSSGWAVTLPSSLCLSHYKVQFLLATCRKITSNPRSKVLLALSIITLAGFVFVSLLRNVLRVYCREALLEVLLFSEPTYPWLYQCPFAVTMLLGSGATYSFIYGLGFRVTIRVTFPNVWVCRRHPNGSLTWKALIVFSFPLLNYLSGPSYIGERRGNHPAH